MKTKIILLGACALFSTAGWAQDGTSSAAQVASEAASLPIADQLAVAKLPAGTAVKFLIDNAMATDKRDDFEEMHAILSGILKSLDAAMAQKEDW